MRRHIYICMKGGHATPIDLALAVALHRPEQGPFGGPRPPKIGAAGPRRIPHLFAQHANTLAYTFCFSCSLLPVALTTLPSTANLQEGSGIPDTTP